MIKMKSKLMVVLALVILAGSVVLASAAPAEPQRTMTKVHKALVTLPYYGVFDNLEYKVEGDTVTLFGQVRNPTTRRDAERRVARIEGVDHVINKIEVLPVSRFDDSIRARTYRAVFRSGSLYRYAMGANPSVHIVVKNGHVTLEGVVSSQMDSQLAYMAARGVPGVFSVTNNLRVGSGS
ncbi:MAG TPA: BON domain-containing protein [Blastocatellia bacterium]|nr:BON domain-containing protein [Blastocatellia bacterium]